MRTKATRILLASAATAALFATGCGSTTDTANNNTPEAGDKPANTSAPKDAGDITIGVSMSLIDQFIQLLVDSVQEEGAAQGVTVNVISAEADAVNQLSQVENFISQGNDAIIVNPVDSDAAKVMTDKAVAAGIPIVYLNRCPADLPEGSACVGSSELDAGTLLMQGLAEISGGEGKVGILQGDPLNNGEAVRLRTQGCTDVIDANPGMELMVEGAGLWTRDKAMNVVENWIQGETLPDLICANNDEMALGAINALKAAGKLDQVKVGGIDATADALVAMEAGDLSVTVFQDAKGQGAGSVTTAIRLINGEDVESFVNIPFELVTPDNMADFK